MAEDEHPVEPGVDQVGDEDRRDDGAGSAERLQALPKDDEQEERQHARREADRVGRGERHHFRGLVGRAEDRPGGEEDGDGGTASSAARMSPRCMPRATAGLIVRANRLGHHRIEHHQRAHAEDADPEEVEVAQRDCREATGEPPAARCPTMTVSTTPMSIMPTWTVTTGTARRSMARSSPRRGSTRPDGGSERHGSGPTVGRAGVRSDRGLARRRSAKSTRSASSATWRRRSSSSSRTSAGTGPPASASSGSQRRTSRPLCVAEAMPLATRMRS